MTTWPNPTGMMMGSFPWLVVEALNLTYQSRQATRNREPEQSTPIPRSCTTSCLIGASED